MTQIWQVFADNFYNQSISKNDLIKIRANLRYPRYPRSTRLVILQFSKREQSNVSAESKR